MLYPCVKTSQLGKIPFHLLQQFRTFSATDCGVSSGYILKCVSLLVYRRTLCNLPDEDFAPLITSNETELYSQAVENVPEKGQ